MSLFSQGASLVKRFFAFQLASVWDIWLMVIIPTILLAALQTSLQLHKLEAIPAVPADTAQPTFLCWVRTVKAARVDS